MQNFEDDDELDPGYVENLISASLDPRVPNPSALAALENLKSHPELPDALISVISGTQNIAIRQSAFVIMQQTIKKQWKQFSLNRKKYFYKYFIDCLRNTNLGSDVCYIMVSSNVSYIVERIRKIFPELNKYILQPPENYAELPDFQARIKLTTDVLQYFPVSTILQNNQLFMGLILPGVESVEGMQLFNKLIKLISDAKENSENIVNNAQAELEELEAMQQNEEVVARIQELTKLAQENTELHENIENVLHSEIFGQICEKVNAIRYSVPNSNYINAYFEVASILSKILDFEPDFVADLLESVCSEDISTWDMISALDHIFANADIEAKLQELFVAVFSREFEEIEIIEELPFIATALKRYQHNLIASILIPIVKEMMNNATTLHLALLILKELIMNAPELFTGEINEICDASVSLAFQSNDADLITKAIEVIKSVDSEDISSLKSVFVKYINNLISCIENANEGESIIEPLICINSVMNFSQSLNQILPKLWQLKDKITQDDLEQYLGLIKKAIDKRDKLETNIASEILSFVAPPLESGCSLTLAGALILVCAAILQKDELTTDILRITQPVLPFLLDCQDELTPPRDALQFLAILCDVMREEASSVSEFFPRIQNILQAGGGGHRNEIWIEAIRTACFTIRYCGNFDAVPLIIEILMKQLNSNSDDSIIDALINIKLITKFLIPESAAQIYAKIAEIARTTGSDEMLERCFDTLVRFAKFFANVVGEDCFELCSQFIGGSLPASQINFESEADFNMTLLDAFTELCYRAVAFSPTAAEQICQAYVNFAARNNESYSILITRVFTGALEADTATEDIVHTYLELLGSIIETSTPNISQQDIIYALNLMVNKFPGNISLVTSQLERFNQWWNLALQNKESFADLAANIASLFLTISAAEPSFPVEILNQAISLYPPSDTTECRRMSHCLLVILTRGEIPVVIQQNVSRGLSLLFAMPTNEFRKLKLDEELVQTLVSVLKQLVSVEANMQAAMNAVQGSESMTTKLMNVLQ